MFGLSRELEQRGNGVEIVLLKYYCLRADRIYGLSVAYDNLVPCYSGAIHCTVWFVRLRRCRRNLMTRSHVCPRTPRASSAQPSEASLGRTDVETSRLAIVVRAAGVLRHSR